MKRVFTYLLVVALLLCGFYAFRTFQMSQIRDSLDRQIASAAEVNATDLGFLKETLEQVRKQYPGADNYSSDPVFTKAPMASRLSAQNSQIIAEGENAIKETRDRTPFIFLTDIIMPGAQQSTDDHYRASLNAHVNSAEYLDFTTTKLKVDDLMSGVRFCRGEPTSLNYGYTDPEPDVNTKNSRAAIINAAAVAHLCPEKG